MVDRLIGEVICNQSHAREPEVDTKESEYGAGGINFIEIILKEECCGTFLGVEGLKEVNGQFEDSTLCRRLEVRKLERVWFLSRNAILVYLVWMLKGR